MAALTADLISCDADGFIFALRRFEPGTTGWTEDHLDLPPIERKWQGGGFEIVEGVLTRKAAAYLEGSLPLRRLVRLVERHLEQSGGGGEFAFEADMVVNRIRVPRVDAVFLTPTQLQHQQAMQALRPAGRPLKKKLRYVRLRVPRNLSASRSALVMKITIIRPSTPGIRLRRAELLDPRLLPQDLSL